MEPCCKPHMLSEYPLGYSRLTYETEDPITVVEAPGYFAAAAPVLRVRDILEIWADIAGSRPVFRTYAVTRADVAGMVVDIEPIDRLARRRRAAKKPDGTMSAGGKATVKAAETSIGAAA